MASNKNELSLVVEKAELEKKEAVHDYVKCIGLALQTFRKLQGRTQSHVAEELKKYVNAAALDQSYVSQVERGRKGVSMTRWIAWCVVLSCNPVDVLSLAESIRATRQENLDAVHTKRKSKRLVPAKG